MLYNFDDLLFQILTIDRFLHKEGHFNVQARPYAALSFRESGTGAFRIGGKNLLTKPGDVLFIPADMPYEVDYSTSESIVVNMSLCNYTEPEIYEISSNAGVSVLFSILLKEWKNNHSVNRAKASVYSILEKIGEYNTAGIESSVLVDCIQYMETHFCDPEFDVRRMCEACFISSSNLYRHFLKHFGIAPMQYVIKLRMNKAIGLLVESRRSVKEIAQICGFSDDKYFSRVFKSFYGYPPMQLRKHTHM